MDSIEVNSPQTEKGPNSLLDNNLTPTRSRAASAVSFSDTLSVYPARSDNFLPSIDAKGRNSDSASRRNDSGSRRPSRVSRRERKRASARNGGDGSVEGSEVQFSSLQKMFEAAEDDGRGGLDIDEFKVAMRKTVGKNSTEDEIEVLFMKVDANCDGRVDWEEYVTYNLLEYKEKTLMFEMLREKPFPNEIRDIDSKHRDTIIRIIFYPSIRKTGGKKCHIDYKIGKYVTLSKEGVIGFWNLKMKNLKYYNAIQSFDKNTQPWFTDLVAMYNVNMLAVASTDRDIAIFDLAAKKFCMRYYVTGFENCITTMDYWVNPVDLNRALLLWGDMAGSVFVFKFENSLRGGPFGAVSGKRNACKRVSFPEVLKGFVPGVRCLGFPNVHEDWVGKVQYLPEFDFFLSSCNAAHTALFFGDFQGKKSNVYFKVNKGVLSFDYSYALNIIVTGGMDYMLRVWNPYVNNKAITLLKGHTKPVNHVIINGAKNQVISIDKGRNLRVFDLRDQNCLQQISGRMIKFDPFPISAVLYNPKMKTMLLAAYQIIMLEKGEEDERHSEILSHQKPIVGAIYSKVFGTCITACQDSVVSVWDTNTGDKVMQFVNAHYRIERGVEVPVEITALCFDHNGRRLVTGARNGTIHVWNFNNGLCMQKFQLPDCSDVTGLVCTKHRIYVTGWGKTVYVYIDGRGEEDRKGWKKQHNEDILCIAYLSPNIIGTGSYDGDVIIWSRETGQVYCRLNAFVSAMPIGENSPHVPKRKDDRSEVDTPSHQTVGSEIEEDESLLNSQTRKRYKFSESLGIGILSRFRNNENEDIQECESKSPDEVVDHPLLQALDTNGANEKEVYCKETYDEVCKTYESAVERMIFLETRELLHKETAIIVTSGAEGWIRFWSMHHEGGLLGQYNSSHRLGESVLGLTSDTNNQFIFTGDTQGYVKIWNIKDYCVSKKMKLREKRTYLEELKKKFTFFRVEAFEEEKYKETVPRHIRNVFSSRPPPTSSDPKRTLKYPLLVNSFRAHMCSIHSVDYVTEREILITASADCSVRIWTLNGQYIGTFGGELWKQLPVVVNTDYFVSQMPSDIRRTGSARTLKVMNAGKTPMWYNAFQIIRNRGIKRLKKQFEHLQDKDDLVEKDEADKVEVSNILGKSYKRMTRHKMPPRLPKLIETPGSVGVYHALSFADLAPVDAFNESMREIQARRAGNIAINRARGQKGQKIQAPGLFTVYTNAMKSAKRTKPKRFGYTSRIKKVADKYQGKTPEMLMNTNKSKASTKVSGHNEAELKGEGGAVTKEDNGQRDMENNDVWIAGRTDSTASHMSQNNSKVDFKLTTLNG